MKIYSVFDKEFSRYGVVLQDDFSQLLVELKKTPLLEKGVVYVPTTKEFDELPIKNYIEKKYFGGLPIQIGYCNGAINELNALEYHKGNEINLSDVDIVLLLGDVRDIVDGMYDTAKVQAFLLPANVAIEMYGTTLHYAPCCKDNVAYRTAIILPKGTNYAKPDGVDDKMLWGSNKWLLTYENTADAKNGAYVGLLGEKIIIE